MKAPRISVIVPTRNRGELLLRLADSVFNRVCPLTNTRLFLHRVRILPDRRLLER